MKHTAAYFAKFPELRRCNACGLCLAVCPDYKIMPEEARSPRGRLLLSLAMNERRIQPMGFFNFFKTCLHCGKCQEICPQKLPLQGLWFALARDMARFFCIKPAQKLLERQLLRSPASINFLQPPLALLACLLNELPMRMRRTIPLLPQNPFVVRNEGKKTRGKEKIALFPGCITVHIWPKLGQECKEVLEHAGYEVIVPRASGCCGRPQMMRGAAILGGIKRNLELLSTFEFKWLVTPCPGCQATIQNIWPHLDGLDAHLQMQANDISAKTRHIAAFIIEEYGVPASRQEQGGVFWHKSCLLSGREALAIEIFLKQIWPDIIKSPPAACCGAPLACIEGKDRKATGNCGSPIKQKLAANIRVEAMSGKASKVVTACPGCLTALTQAMGHWKQQIAVEHIVSCLASLFGQEGRRLGGKKKGGTGVF